MKPFSLLAASIMALAAPTAAAPSGSALCAAPRPNTTLADLRLNTALSGQDTPPGHKTPSGQEVNAYCTRQSCGFSWLYKVYIGDLQGDSRSLVCHRLWRGLKEHKLLCLVSNPHCGKAGQVGEGFDHWLEWRFEVPLGCNVGAVASGFWTATFNKYGAMDQRGCSVN